MARQKYYKSTDMIAIIIHYYLGVIVRKCEYLFHFVVVLSASMQRDVSFVLLVINIRHFKFIVYIPSTRDTVTSIAYLGVSDSQNT